MTEAEQSQLPDGATVSLKLMGAEDQDAVVAFAKALPEEDLLFLSLDITDPKAVAGWIANIESERATTIAAYDEQGLVGYANVQKNTTPWMRRVGEIRVNVAPSYRGRGLGRLLINRIFDIARGQGLKKIIAQMTADQRGAQSAFRRLGFVPEAMLADFVVDRHDHTHDLVMMTYDVDGLTDQAGDVLQI